MDSQADRFDHVPGDVFVAGAGGFPSDTNLFAKKGEGAYLQMEDGKEYVDYLLGGGPLLLGHNHPDVIDAVQAQAENGATFYLSNEKGMKLAQQIVDAVPCAEQIKLVSTGSQATYFALRLARAYTGCSQVLKFAGAYHGWHDYALRSSSYADPSELAAKDLPDGTVDSAGIVEAASESVLVGPYNDLERTREIINDKSEDLAAIIVEPMMRSLPPVDGFLEGLREICDDNNIVLIFDEVVTGFRLAWGGGQEKYDVTPDLATYGKTIGGGTPMAAVCGAQEIMRLSDPSVPVEEHGAYLSGTLAGNPLCAAAGIATLDVLDQSGTYDGLNHYADRLRNLIDDLFQDSSLSGTSIGDGPVVDYLITDADDVTMWPTVLKADNDAKKKIDSELLQQGILQLHGSKRYISTAHGEEEFKQTAEAYKNAIAKVE